MEEFLGLPRGVSRIRKVFGLFISCGGCRLGFAFWNSYFSSILFLSVLRAKPTKPQTSNFLNPHRTELIRPRLISLRNPK